MQSSCLKKSSTNQACHIIPRKLILALFTWVHFKIYKSIDIFTSWHGVVFCTPLNREPLLPLRKQIVEKFFFQEESLSIIWTIFYLVNSHSNNNYQFKPTCSMQNLTLKPEKRPITKAKGFPLPVWGREGQLGRANHGSSSARGGAQRPSIPRTGKEHSWKKWVLMWHGWQAQIGCLTQLTHCSLHREALTEAPRQVGEAHKEQQGSRTGRSEGNKAGGGQMWEWRNERKIIFNCNIQARLVVLEGSHCKKNSRK